MKKIASGHARKMLTAVVAVVFLFGGLGLLGYFLFASGSAASADSPGRVHGRISVELEKKFQRSIPERIVEKIRGPRIKSPESKLLKLTVPELERVDDVSVYDAPKSGYERALHDGLVHVRGTQFPWHKEANVYIAGHRVGYPGTKSNLVFWDLNELEKGDKIYLTDAEGTRYTYVVFKKQVISPDKLSILRPMKGKNIVSLQTCTLPDYSHRLIVQGELKDKTK